MSPLRVVVDANVVAAALIRPEGWTAQELARADVEWFAPSFLMDDLKERGSEYAGKAGCTPLQWARRVAGVARRVRVVSSRDMLLVARHALVRQAEAIDEDDAPCVAAVVAIEADFLWTRDAAMLKAFPGIAVTVVPRRG